MHIGRHGHGGLGQGLQGRQTIGHGGGGGFLGGGGGGGGELEQQQQQQQAKNRLTIYYKLNIMAKS